MGDNSVNVEQSLPYETNHYLYLSEDRPKGKIPISERSFYIQADSITSFTQAEQQHGELGNEVQPQSITDIQVKQANGAPSQAGAERKNIRDDRPTRFGIRKRISNAYDKCRFSILSYYRRLFTIILVANIVALVFVARSGNALMSSITAVALNLLATGLARYPFASNILYYLTDLIPRSAPLCIRRRVAKVHHYGGIHSGCGASTLMWYITFIVFLSKAYMKSSLVTPATIILLVISYALLAILMAIVIAAYPTIRVQKHNTFEATHRFLGWAAILLVWPLLFVFARVSANETGTSLIDNLWNLPAFWCTVVLTFITVHPWLLLSEVPVQAEYLSDWAVRLHFAHRTIKFAQGHAVSRHPLRDWHSFATFPDANNFSFSSLVSKAGDWTSDCIANPPTRLWKRGYPAFGAVYGMKLFKSFVVVTTGSGIGPCMSFLAMENPPPMRVIWQTRSPVKTYGQTVIDEVKRLDPNPVIIDTDKLGRQNIMPYIESAMRDISAEAVAVVSNPRFTFKTVFDLESRGIPAYGPIFDS